ncbi:NACHT domain-containing protein [Streptomyces davaonensis]|uniref:NACHT domain-containing protein n=1 Tax=Streptomyces davaonensis TaxID=348043 RepID=UPI001E5EE8B8|nr:NACHT domain-containing protein [Streptomyces davaonensis]
MAIAIGWRTLPRVAAGEADPVGAAIGLVGLAAGIWSGWLTVRSLRWQETNLTEVAGRLAVEVLAAEREARRQLLGDHDKTIDLEFALLPAPAHDAAGARPQGHLDDVVGYYQDLRPGRMVITGEPGAGKTVLALELMLGLLTKRKPDDPVPVRLSLASWGDELPLADWIARHLTEAYRLPAVTASALVKARRVLPVLDGLDEMDADSEPGYDSRAGHALRRLNSYQQGLDKAELVLTCRRRTYQALEALRVWTQDAARVEIHRVDGAMAREFFSRRVDDLTRWREVLESFGRNPQGPLATGLSTPWRLTLAVTVYEQRDPRTGRYLRDPRALLSSALDTADAVGAHLLASFIPAVTALHPGPRGVSYSPQQVRAWLTVLGSYLHRNGATARTVGGRALSGTDIVLHELWPLAGTRLPRAATVALVAMTWVTGSAILLAQVPTGFSQGQLLAAGLVVLAAMWMMLMAWGILWPQPSRADLRRLRSSAGRRSFAKWFMVGPLGVLAFGFTFGLTGRGLGILVFGLVVGILGGLTGALEASGTLGVVSPKDIVRDDFALGLAVGLTGVLVFEVAAGLTGQPAEVLAFGLAIALTFELVGALRGVIVFGLSGGLSAGLSGGLSAGLGGLRYVAFLLCTRRWSGRWLPWRLGRFLHWCYGAGLIRVAGIAYQFRHRELQDYLATTGT